MTRFAALLALGGVLAVASLLLVPFELLAPTSVPPAALRLLATVQPLVLTLAAVGLGLWAAPKVGLDAPLIRALAERRPGGAVLRRQWPAAVPVGLVVALVLLTYGALVPPVLAEAGASAERFARLQPPLATKLLYGGVGEELLTRWGLMSLFVWVAWRASLAPAPSATAHWAGAAAASALFAAGHLPLLFLLVPDPPPGLIAAVLAGNFVPGLLFGWLYWRRGLEAAMIAHALAHLVSTAVTGWL